MNQPVSLLLIDDDRELCELMKIFFGQQGFQVQAVNDGEAGLEALQRGGIDLIVLDIMMPGIDGLEVLRRIRGTSMIPVIMLTARTEQQDRVAGLDAGADDYLPKPFAPPELLARIRAVLRRSRLAAAAGDPIEVAGVRLDPSIRTVWQNDRELDLTSIEFTILEILMRSAGRVVSRDQLTAALYRREATPYERTIDVHVSNLRKKLEARGQAYIITVRGAGYLFRSKSPS
jgi:two-component system, OmpR family, response regulator CpxR